MLVSAGSDEWQALRSEVQACASLCSPGGRFCAPHHEPHALISLAVDQLRSWQCSLMLLHISVPWQIEMLIQGEVALAFNSI